MHWDGRRWRIFKGLAALNATNGDSSLHGVAVVSMNDVWAVGEDDEGNTATAVINHWNGARWSGISAKGGALEDVAAASSDEVWAVGIADTEQGSGEVIDRWDGRSWKPVRGANPEAALSALTVVGEDDIWAVGGTQAGSFAEHFSCS
jgi:hypothetical protein